MLKEDFHAYDKPNNKENNNFFNSNNFFNKNNNFFNNSSFFNNSNKNNKENNNFFNSNNFFNNFFNRPNHANINHHANYINNKFRIIVFFFFNAFLFFFRLNLFTCFNLFFTIPSKKKIKTSEIKEPEIKAPFIYSWKYFFNLTRSKDLIITLIKFIKKNFCELKLFLGKKKKEIQKDLNGSSVTFENPFGIFFYYPHNESKKSLFIRFTAVLLLSIFFISLIFFLFSTNLSFSEENQEINLILINLALIIVFISFCLHITYSIMHVFNKSKFKQELNIIVTNIMELYYKGLHLYINKKELSDKGFEIYTHFLELYKKERELYMTNKKKIKKNLNLDAWLKYFGL